MVAWFNCLAKSSVQGGFFGLTKSLKFEWPHVSCKAIDINPKLSKEDSIKVIFEELGDFESQRNRSGRN